MKNLYWILYATYNSQSTEKDQTYVWWNKNDFNISGFLRLFGWLQILEWDKRPQSMKNV